MLTDRQEHLVRLIWQFLLERGRYPSIRELAPLLGVASINGVMCHISGLEKKGVIERGDYSTHSQRDAYRLAAVTLEPKIASSEAGDALRSILDKACKHAAK